MFVMKTILPIVFNRDVAPIQHPIRLHSSKDLVEVTDLAQDRKRWSILSSPIEKSYRRGTDKELGRDTGISQVRQVSLLELRSQGNI